MIGFYLDTESVPENHGSNSIYIYIKNGLSPGGFGVISMAIGR